MAADAGRADACRARSVALAEVVARSDALVVAKVLSSVRRAPRYRGRTATMLITARITTVIAGTARVTQVLKLSHSEPMPVHRRGGKTYCPMWEGSGIEFSLKPGTAYYFVLDGRRLRRAVRTKNAKKLKAAWASRHWSQAAAARFSRASVVVRATVVKAKGGSKYHWTTVRPLRVFKNTSHQTFHKAFDVAQYGSSRALKPGTHTLYLEPYGRTRHWRLLGGSPALGASHHQRTPPANAP